jgi:hypothetical protein
MLFKPLPLKVFSLENNHRSQSPSISYYCFQNKDPIRGFQMLARANLGQSSPYYLVFGRLAFLKSMFVHISNVAGLEVVLLPKGVKAFKKPINSVRKVFCSPGGLQRGLGLRF